MTDPQPAPQAPGPLVAWEPPVVSPAVPASSAGGYAGPPDFTVGALLADTFSRYGADFVRLFLVSALASVLSWLGSFAAPIGSSPFGRPTGFVDVSGLLSLASFVVGIVGSATVFALAEGGRAVPFGRAVRRGVERAGWLFLTTLLLGVAFVGVFLLALIPIGLFYFLSPALAFVPVLILVAFFIWAAMRLSLALPANVADNLNSIEAVRLSWRVTKPGAIWLRLLGAALLLGLLALPAGIGALLLAFPAMFSGGAQAAFLLLPALAFSLLTPLSALLSFSAYRRLVPPLQPSWTLAPPVAPTAPPAAPPATPAPGEHPAAPVGIDAPPRTGTGPAETSTPTAPPATTAAVTAAADEPAPSLFVQAEGAPETALPGDAVAIPSVVTAEPAPPPAAPPAPAAPPPPPAPPAAAAPAFRAPPFGTAAKAILALILAFDVAGLLAIPYGVGELVRLAREGFPGLPGAPGSPGFPGFPGGDGAVFPGQVIFGTDADLDTCTVRSPLFIVTASTEVEWIAALRPTVTPQDEVFLRITKDGQELETTLQDPGTYDCLGSEAGVPGLVAGIYTYEVVVNGSISATGSLFVQ